MLEAQKLTRCARATAMAAASGRERPGPPGAPRACAKMWRPAVGTFHTCNAYVTLKTSRELQARGTSAALFKASGRNGATIVHFPAEKKNRASSGSRKGAFPSP